MGSLDIVTNLADSAPLAFLSIPQWILTLLLIFSIDILFLVVWLAWIVVMAVFMPAAFAVLKRNFVGYFSNPTGYVFLVLFVLLTSFAAFWPHAFFTNNLANLDQLNTYMPLIMLVFIPAITMSTWAEERRQGTDELLLTLPATDVDIVMGKYLAAAAIFTVSLLFSQLSHGSVLVSLTFGDLDVLQLAVTYFGYWLMGLAMLSIGMVASFLTSNLTIGFVLGAALNAPLAAASNADVIFTDPWLTANVRHWSLGGQFESFGRGVLSLSSIVYFLMIIFIGLYLCMVLIGRRHWLGGRDGSSMLGHFLLRIVAFFALAIGLNVLLVTVTLLNWRVDATENQVSSLAPDTRRLLLELDSKTKNPIQIEAFVSREVPPDYVKTRYDLVNMLKEFQAVAGSRKIELTLHENLEPFSEEAASAEKRFGITPQRVRTTSRGAIREEEVILAAAFSCGLERVVVPFFDYGVPVEYELIRSVATVAEQERKTVGVLRTDAQLYGGFTMGPSGPAQAPRQAIIEELEKQYDVEEVDASNPIDVWVEEIDDEGKKSQVLKYDVLLAVQPSSLDPAQLNNFIDAVRNGQPTAIFEDPAPTFLSAPGTTRPRSNPMGMFGGGAPPQKGDIRQLWDLLGIDAVGETERGQLQPNIIWQQYNPYRQFQTASFPLEFVIIRGDMPARKPPFSEESPITSGLEEVLLPYAGAIRDRRESEYEFSPLVMTGAKAGMIGLSDLEQYQGQPNQLQFRRGRPRGDLILAASIRGEVPQDEGESELSPSGEQSQRHELDVVYVADIDVLSSPFVNVRARPDAGEGVVYRFDNITFVLNVLDQLAGEKDFLEIRKRKTKYSTLKVIEAADERARADEFAKRKEFNDKFEKARKAAEEARDKASEDLRKVVEDLQRKIKEGDENVSIAEANATRRNLQIRDAVEQQKFENEISRLERERDNEIANIRRQKDLDILAIQNGFKFWAVMIPWILPALVGLVVFVRRRLREREGITKSRLR
ncbi:MAG: Gldg family protein [Pirellulaceae bacterium]